MLFGEISLQGAEVGELACEGLRGGGVVNQCVGERGRGGSWRAERGGCRGEGFQSKGAFG